MKTKKLYTTNHTVLENTIKQIAEKRIVKFETQASLYCFIENIKNPHVILWRNNDSQPYYMPVNYIPIVDHMISNGLLTRVNGYRKNVIAYEVTAVLSLYTSRSPQKTYTV
jgi:hypothetical protein